AVEVARLNPHLQQFGRALLRLLQRGADPNGFGAPPELRFGDQRTLLEWPLNIATGNPLAALPQRRAGLEGHRRIGDLFEPEELFGERLAEQTPRECVVAQSGDRG